MAESVVVVALLRAKAEKEDELASRLQALVQSSHLDAGVMAYNLHHSIEDPASWFLYERYESQEHLNKHKENAVLRSFLADAPTLLEGNVDIRTFRAVSE
jgi:quinol monooxygenase YgiN